MPGQRLPRLAAWLAGLWAGAILAIGLIGAPSAFAVLPGADAGRAAGQMFAREAYLTLAAAMLLFFIERRRARDAAEAGVGSVLSANLVLVLLALFCTVFGYFGLQPMMAAARTGQGTWSFGALHGASMAFYVVKAVVVATLAWRLTTAATLSPRPTS